MAGSADSPGRYGWEKDAPNSRVNILYAGTTIGYINASGLFNSAGAAVTGAYADNTLLTLGTDTDVALVNRASILGANTALTGVIVGTPVTPAVAANSLLIGNVTADGDILVATQTGGNSHAYIWVDTSAAIMRLYGGAGVEKLQIGATGPLLLDDVTLLLGSSSDIALVNRASVLNANTTLTGVIVGTPVTPALPANSLVVGNVTADGDMLFATQTGGNSHAFMWYDTSAALLRLYGGAGVEAVKVGDATVTLTGTVDMAGTFRRSAAGFFGFGTGEAVTIATGVATVTKPYVILDAEGAGTTDQLDTITYTGVADGDILVLVTTATDTITVDDANINLGAATRAIAPGGTLVLRYDGGESQWTEVSFLAAADNA